MEVLEHLAGGLATALAPEGFLACLAGVLLGTLVGVLPGVGPLTTIALLLPFTFSLSPPTALIMLAGIYYGAQSGGSTTAILVNLPGEASSAVTCVDGYEMARRGRGGSALAVAALGSFFAGCVAALVVALLAAPLAGLARRFEAADYAALIILGLVAATTLGNRGVGRASAMALLGLLLGTVGTDVGSGTQRFTLGIAPLADGIGVVPLTIGLFALGEIIHTLAHPVERRERAGEIGRRWPSRDEAGRSLPAVVRGTALGSALGVLPGGGPMIASFGAYALEKRLARDPSRFGRGAIEGVAGPESANNAAAQTSFIPLLTLGLPSNPVMALFVGAMLVHGVQPGPNVIGSQPELFWGLVASMLVGNLLLVLVNLPLIGFWIRLLRVPYRILFPATLLLSCVGIYTLSHSAFDLLLTAGFGVLGYLLRHLGFDLAPVLLAFVLSRPLEENLGRALLFADGDITTFLTHPLSAAFLSLAVVLLASSLRAPRRARPRG